MEEQYYYEVMLVGCDGHSNYFYSFNCTISSLHNSWCCRIQLQFFYSMLTSTPPPLLFTKEMRNIGFYLTQQAFLSSITNLCILTHQLVTPIFFFSATLSTHFNLCTKQFKKEKNHTPRLAPIFYPSLLIKALLY